MPEEYDIEQIIQSYDLVEYASKYTTLEPLNHNSHEYLGICPNPQHVEHTASFSVNSEKQTFYCFGCHWGGTIINFIMAFEKDKNGKNIRYYDALDKLANGKDIQKIDVSSIQSVAKKYKRGLSIPEYEHLALPLDIMGEKTEEITEWQKEGISSSIMDEFQVRRNKIQLNSIEFPIWDNKGNIISVCRRTINPEWKKLKIPKYVYYNKIQCLDFFYGWYQNQEFIKSKNEIILFEGAKSVYKSVDYGYNNSCALLTSNMSPEQIMLLILNKVESVVFALDKEVPTEKIKDMTKLLHHYCKIYYIDSSCVLKDKESPVDNGKAIFDRLYQEKKII